MSTKSKVGSVDVEVFKSILKSADQLVGSIDQGTSSTRFLLFTNKGQIAASAQTEHAQLYPKPGWHEHDPVILWKNTSACIEAVMKTVGNPKTVVAAIGVTNQRETTIAWNRETGKPYYNAIVWDDTRTQEIAAAIQDTDQLTATTGLPSSSYFAGTKVKWLLDNVETLRTDVETKPHVVCFGTVDTWLLYQLTGHFPKSPTSGRKLKGVSTNVGGIFQTDVTNASRWMFLDLKTRQWDPTSIATVCAPHHLPVECLPEIQPSSHVFGTIAPGCGLPTELHGVPLAAVLGDQQAALFGQAAFLPGEAKNTYGTGLFLMMNTGPKIVPSTHGLLTTIAYQLGKDEEVCYALEGSVSHAGSTIQWLRDQLSIIPDAAASETQAKRVKSNEGLYFVPAFAGLLAPHWRADARACLVGLTAAHHAGHVCRAALEATCFQTLEVFDAIVADSGVTLQSLKVDGGGTQNALMMQFQADMIQVPVVQPVVMETTAMGAAFAAGLAVGVWKSTQEISQLWAVAKTYEPRMEAGERQQNMMGWIKAVSKSLGWVGDDNDGNVEQATTRDVPQEDEVSISPPKEEPLPTVWIAGALTGACLLGVVIGRLSVARKQ